MNILHSNNNKNSIAYHKHFATKREAPCLVFHHGFMSNMDGIKALFVEKYCKERDYNFIRFDNFGHGKSSGKFIDQTISNWLEGLLLVIDELTSGSVILVGSSLGAWISTLAAIAKPERIASIVAVSSAFDFTEELIWKNLDIEQRNTLIKDGVCEVDATNPECPRKYPINFNLIRDAREHLLLNRDNINIMCPLHLIHGMNDMDVPYSISMRIAEKVISENVVLKLIKDGNHGLSRLSDLQVICNSIEEMVLQQV